MDWRDRDLDPIDVKEQNLITIKGFVPWTVSHYCYYYRHNRLLLLSIILVIRPMTLYTKRRYFSRLGMLW